MEINSISTVSASVVMKMSSIGVVLWDNWNIYVYRYQVLYFIVATFSLDIIVRVFLC